MGVQDMSANLNLRDSRLIFAAAILLLAVFSSCEKNETAKEVVPDEASVAVPDNPDESLKAIAKMATLAGKSPEELRDEAVKRDILVEYSSVVTAPGQGAHPNQGPATVNPTTHRLCWPAMTCTNPKCSGKGSNGKPYLFAYRHSAVTIGPDGKPDWSANVYAPSSIVEGICPACLNGSFVTPYIPPDVRLRFEELSQKIKKIDREMKEIMQSGQYVPKEKYQEFTRLFDERATMPVEYLCE